MRGHTRFIPSAMLAVGLLAALSPAVAQGPIADFEPTDYLVSVDGSKVDAEVWQSRISGQLLILSDELGGPVRLVLRDAKVEKVQFMKVEKRPDGGLTLLPGAGEEDLGKFQVAPGGGGVLFSVDGHAVELGQKPSLLGDQDLNGMFAYSRDYVRLAQAYTPSKPYLERLRGESREVRVEVYFGSWCGFCQEYVPRMLRVAQDLEGSKIDFEFYGLPQGDGFMEDPKAKALGLTGVPTGVVYMGGREIGRIQANGWKIPELTLNGLLVKQ